MSTTATVRLHNCDVRMRCGRLRVQRCGVHVVHWSVALSWSRVRLPLCRLRLTSCGLPARIRCVRLAVCQIAARRGLPCADCCRVRVQSWNVRLRRLDVRLSRPDVRLRHCAVRLEGGGVCLRGWRVCLRGWRVCLRGWRVCLRGWRVCLRGWDVCLTCWTKGPVTLPRGARSAPQRDR